jgi:hypothetical protein
MYSEVRVTATQLMSRSITNAVEGNLQEEVMVQRNRPLNSTL